MIVAASTIPSGTLPGRFASDAGVPLSTPLYRLGRALQDTGYDFVTPTPLTIERVNARPENAAARSLRDFFGWSRPGPVGFLPPAILALAEEAGILEQRGPLIASQVRFSSLSGMLFVHSAFPTLSADSVFFGPDTYRFARLIEQTIQALPEPPRSILDLGCGSGAGGLVAARASGKRPGVVLSDINPRALQLARVNAALADTPALLVASDLCAALTTAPRHKFELIVANPPYLRDPAGRIYRDGGGSLGEALSLRILREGLLHLAPGGRLVLYTASAIVAGHDLFRTAAEQIIAHAGLSFDYREIDPDVFGEELEAASYRDAERIAVVSLIVCA